MWLKELGSELRSRISEAAPIELRAVTFESGEPQANKCHENVATYTREHPNSKAVRGWLIVTDGPGGSLFHKHSIIEEDGILFDITPRDFPQMRFLHHWGSETDFEKYPAEKLSVPGITD